MKTKLFIFQLLCLFFSNFTYSTEEVTKSATKQILFSIGTTVVTTTLWANKESIYSTIKGAFWVAEAINNNKSHKKTQQELEKGFVGLKSLLEKTNDNMQVMLPHIEEMKATVAAININTQEVKTIIDTNNKSTNSKIDALLNNANQHVTDYFSPIKNATMESLQLNKQIEARTNTMDKKLDQILAKIDKK